MTNSCFKMEMVHKLQLFSYLFDEDIRMNLILLSLLETRLSSEIKKRQIHTIVEGFIDPKLRINIPQDTAVGVPTHKC